MLQDPAALLGAAPHISPRHNRLEPALAGQQPGGEASPNPSDWKVKLIGEKELLRGWWYPNALFFSDGIIICSVSSSDGKSRLTTYSVDQGNSWKRQEVVDRKSEEYLDALGNGAYKQLFDGSVIGLMFHSVVQEIAASLHQTYQPFIAHVRRAKSATDLLSGNYVDDFARVSIPDLAPGFGDDGKSYTGSIDHSIVELANGDLLMTMYGSFRGDNIPIPYFHHGTMQYRTWLCISKDRGNSWSYLATVASPEASPLPKLAEGYCEPDLISVGEGDLLVVMRSGGHTGPEGNTDYYTPLYANFSHDGGRTWTEPRAIYKYGVWPRLLKLKDGTLVCESGRPGVFLLFSGDNGKTWSAPFVISSMNARWGYCPSGYNSIAEIEPGVLALIYDTYESDSSGSSSHVVKMARYEIHAR